MSVCSSLRIRYPINEPPPLGQVRRLWKPGPFSC
jgi:hypothetical protein